MKSFRDLREKTLTPAEKKKREEIAKAMERDNPGMDMKKKMAIATWQAKKVAEAYEEEPASPDEKSMAMRQAKFIQYVGDEIMEHLEQDGDFPEWMQNKLSEFHQKAKDMHSTMAGSYDDDKEDMDESTVNEISKKTLGSYVKKASADVANRSADNARDYATGNRPVGVNKKAMKIMKRQSNINKAVDKMANEAVQSADRKPEKFIKPDGKVGIRMVSVDKKVVDKDA